MNTLILNWRDPKNPKSGGAEKLNLHILKPFLDRGDKVFWYAMGVSNLPKREEYNGITIIRFGNAFTNLFFWPFFYWTGRFGKVDFIIDSIHGTGFLSSFIAPKVKKRILICEVAQNIWDEMYPFPVNKIGRAWERIMFVFYKKDKFWTISESTKNDLVRFGVANRNIDILPMGFDAAKLSNVPKKYSVPTALFVGRLAEMKGIEDAIKAIFKVNQGLDKKWKLNIIGRGEKEYEQELKSLVKKLKMQEYVHFLGFVSEKEKFSEMAKAWVLLVPSSREGWGMIVPEANFVGTPAVGYDVAGLRDVLSRYSKLNRVVKRGEGNIVNELLNIKEPITVKEKIRPGWEDLYRYIQQHI
jgi:glycosyltransferase involved in cell wall biosynthesis